MLLVRDWQARPPAADAVAIGNFDGVHLGHQALLECCHKLSSGRVGVVTFSPLPVEVLFPGRAPGRVNSTRQRLETLRAQGVDMTWLLRFNHDLAQQTPAAFIQRILVDGLQAQHVVVGEDFRFGHQRAGDVDSLRRAGEQHGFQVHPQAAVSDGEGRISSTRIRQALKDGDMDMARRLLGRRYAIAGRVIRGQQLGRRLGFPTINIDVSRWACLLTGVFAVRVVLEQRRERLELPHETTHNDPLAAQPLAGVASIGYRPSVTDTVSANRHLLEVHIFDWSGDLYGRRVRVEFIRRLREERRYDDLDTLTRQMHQDSAQARVILNEDG